MTRKTYLFDYWLHGKKYKFSIEAESLEEAKLKLYALQTGSPVYKGILKYTIPVPSFIARVWAFFRGKP